MHCDTHHKHGCPDCEREAKYAESGRYDDWATSFPTYIPKKFRPYIVGEYRLQTSVDVPAIGLGGPGTAQLQFDIPTDGLIYSWRWYSFRTDTNANESACFLTTLLQSQRTNWLTTVGKVIPTIMGSQQEFNPNKFRWLLFAAAVKKSNPFAGTAQNSSINPCTVQLEMNILELDT